MRSRGRGAIGSDPPCSVVVPAVFCGRGFHGGFSRAPAVGIDAPNSHRSLYLDLADGNRMRDSDRVVGRKRTADRAGSPRGRVDAQPPVPGCAVFDSEEVIRRMQRRCAPGWHGEVLGGRYVARHLGRLTDYQLVNGCLEEVTALGPGELGCSATPRAGWPSGSPSPRPRGAGSDVVRPPLPCRDGRGTPGAARPDHDRPGVPGTPGG